MKTSLLFFQVARISQLFRLEFRLEFRLLFRHGYGHQSISGWQHGGSRLFRGFSPTQVSGGAFG